MHPTFMVSFTDETGNTIKVKIEIKIDSRYQRQDNQYIYIIIHQDSDNM